MALRRRKGGRMRRQAFHLDLIARPSASRGSPIAHSQVVTAAAFNSVASRFGGVARAVARTWINGGMIFVRSAALPGLTPCAYRKSSPSILVMQSTQDWTAQHAPRCLGGT